MNNRNVAKLDLEGAEESMQAVASPYGGVPGAAIIESARQVVLWKSCI